MGPRLTGRAGFVLLLIAGLLLGALPGARPAAKRPPNIVLIFADDLGYETLGCNGGNSYRTPVLDRMAREGMRFTHAYAQPLCAPTRVQLMTGKYNHRNWVAFGILDPRERTFGHFLKDAGYATAMAGKWQLTSYDPPDYPGAAQRRGIGMLPQNGGFDAYSLWHAAHTEDKGSRYADPTIFENGRLRHDTHGRYGEALWVEFLGDFMARHRERPFFAYYSMALTHAPFNPTPDSPDWGDPAKRLQADPRHFRDMVEYMDRSIGRLLAKIDALGLREETLVLFTSDNGTPRGIFSRVDGRVVEGGKGLTTDAGTHVPLLARWPGTIPAGRTCDALVDSTDYLPTFLAAAGATTPKGAVLDGVSFLPQLRGDQGQPREWIFSHYDPRPGWDKDQYTLKRSARDHRFKLYDDGRLYDIPADPGEARPLPAGQASEIRRKLQAVLDRYPRPQPKEKSP